MVAFLLFETPESETKGFWLQAQIGSEGAMRAAALEAGRPVVVRRVHFYHGAARLGNHIGGLACRAVDSSLRNGGILLGDDGFLVVIDGGNGESHGLPFANTLQSLPLRVPWYSHERPSWRW